MKILLSILGFLCIGGLLLLVLFVIGSRILLWYLMRNLKRDLQKQMRDLADTFNVQTNDPQQEFNRALTLKPITSAKWVDREKFNQFHQQLTESGFEDAGSFIVNEKSTLLQGYTHLKESVIATVFEMDGQLFLKINTRYADKGIFETNTIESENYTRPNPAGTGTIQVEFYPDPNAEMEKASRTVSDSTHVLYVYRKHLSNRPKGKYLMAMKEDYQAMIEDVYKTIAQSHMADDDSYPESVEENSNQTTGPVRINEKRKLPGK